MKTWKKYLWIPGIFIFGYLVWYYLKLKVYDIAIPEKPLVTERWDGAWVVETGGDKIHLYKEYCDFLQTKSDSIIWPKGVHPDPALKNAETADYSLIWPQGTLPLQIAKVWKDKFAYTKVLRWMPANTTDTVLPWDGNYDLFLRMDLPGDKTKHTGIYKDNFEENNIVLTLKKPNPVKIVALWENFLITGETDGKSVKITVPRAATRFNNSLIRVWVCDSNEVSRVCEIPLKKGIVVTKMSVADLKPEVDKTQGIGLFYELVDIHSGLIRADIHFANKIERIMKDETYIPVLMHGDIRGMQVQEDINAIVSSYFGKKIICVFNASDKIKEISIPLKGDLKHTANGNTFRQKGGNVLITLKAKSWEILY